MKWFSNLKIARKLTLSFAVVLTLMVGLGIFAVVQFAKLYEVTDSITSNRLPSLQQTEEIGSDNLTIRRYTLGVLAAEDAAAKVEETQRFEESVTETKSDIAKYAPL